ncbi:hypothetical protein [Psychroserpens burtonensis]|uniref:hypothetical protein n=1 Tax=Psychroserpens burtonensis TaxID=49278 RepID=UPI000403E0D1|nr:hypothetical protein [Psychroserpens burtonensis]
MENEYKWRPNDNSSSTRLKYDLEVEHWLKSYKSAQLKTTSSQSSLHVISLVFSLAFNLVLLLVLGIGSLIKLFKD